MRKLKEALIVLLKKVKSIVVVWNKRDLEVNVQIDQDSFHSLNEILIIIHLFFCRFTKFIGFRIHFLLISPQVRGGIVTFQGQSHRDWFELLALNFLGLLSGSKFVIKN